MLKPELLRAIVDCGFEHPSAGKLARDGSRLRWFRLPWSSPSSPSLSAPRSQEFANLPVPPNSSQFFCLSALQSRPSASRVPSSSQTLSARPRLVGSSRNLLGTSPTIPPQPQPELMPFKVTEPPYYEDQYQVGPSMSGSGPLLAWVEPAPEAMNNFGGSLCGVQRNIGAYRLPCPQHGRDIFLASLAL